MNRFTSLARRLPAALFVVAVPLFLIMASVTLAFNDPAVYQRGFEKYNISLITGITDADLRQAGADIRDYFNSFEEPLEVRARIFGVEQELFNQREALHMQDVKRMVWGVYLLAALSGLYIAVGALWLLRRRRFEDGERLARLCLWGGGLTVGLAAAVGLFSLVGFDTLFLKFHQISFANDFWQLDPRSDYLVMMFPQEFWFDATLWVGTLAVAGAVIISALAGGYLIYRRWATRNPAYAPTGEPSAK